MIIPTPIQTKGICQYSLKYAGGSEVGVVTFSEICVVVVLYSYNYVDSQWKHISIPCRPTVWHSRGRAYMGRGLLCLFYPGKSMLFKMAVTESDLDTKV